MFSARFLGTSILLALFALSSPAVAGLSIVADLDSNATNGPDSIGVDEGDTVLVRIWITEEDSLYAFGVTFGDTSGVLQWIQDTLTNIYVVPTGWDAVGVQLQSDGTVLLQATDFSLSTLLHTPAEIARLEFLVTASDACPVFICNSEMSGWMDDTLGAREFTDFEGAKICSDNTQWGGFGPMTGGGISTDADWSVARASAADALGRAVATAGDINGDGYSDVLVGAPHYQDTGSGDTLGAVYVFLGSADGLETSPDTILVGGDEHGLFGFAVSSAGDVTGDGLHDFLVGAPEYVDVANDVDGGAVFVYTWASGVVLDTTLSQNRSGAEFGYAVSYAGKINNDQYDDFVVGAPGFDDNAFVEGGAAFTYHGASGGPVNIAAATLTLDIDGSRFGHSVSWAGDVDADGRKDLIVGAPGVDDGGTDNGAAFVYLGATGGIQSTITWSDTGSTSGDELGSAVAGAGDVDGNGYADIVVGAPSESSNDGAAYVYQSYSGGIADTFEVALGTGQAGDEYGFAVATAGDVDGDGYADVIIGAPLFDNGESNEGAGFLYYGSDSGLAAGTCDTLEANSAGARLGTAVATAGDVDGRGYSDLILGAPASTLGSGSAFVFHGDLFEPDSTFSWAGNLDEAGAFFGGSIDATGDINGDGYSDLAVGMRGFGANEGAVMLYLGSDSGLTSLPTCTLTTSNTGAQFGTSVALADINGDGYSDIAAGAPRTGPTRNLGTVYLYYGGATGPYDILDDTLGVSPTVSPDTAFFGHSVANAGDINADGIHDLVIGAPRWSLTAFQSFEGRAFVFLGGKSGMVATPSDTLEPPDNGETGHEFGSSVGSAGDFNGDGYGDVIVGAYTYSNASNGVQNVGYAAIYRGGATRLQDRDSTPFWNRFGATANVLSAGEEFGWAVAHAGDVNGDGFSDVAIGSRRWRNPTASEGRFTVYLGGRKSDQVDSTGTVEGDGDLYQMGYSVAGAGDINGDGYSDVIVGANQYDGGGAPNNAGRVQVFIGVETGMSTVPYWTFVADDNSAHLGDAVSGFCDLNGDGFPDLVSSASEYNNGTISGGRVYVHYGNRSGGLDRIARQVQPDSTEPLASLGKSDSQTQFVLKALGRTPSGRDDVFLSWDVEKGRGLFSPSGFENGSTVTTGTVGASGSTVDLVEPVQLLYSNQSYRWALSVESPNPFFPRTPRFNLAYNGPAEIDFRVSGTATSVSAGVPNGRRSTIQLGANRPNPFNPTTNIRFRVSRQGRVGLEVYDIQGRRVVTLQDGVVDAGEYVVPWDGMNASGRPVSSGIYIVRLTDSKGSVTRKMSLIR